ncbi:MAG TPA: glycoside hydrolase family 130 protein [bacterium]|nr:glycoside hydrolase family 130 protein [bacterium]
MEMDKNNILRSSSVIKRHDCNPVLSAHDIPYESNLVFNAGVAKYNGEYIMAFRNDYGYKEGKGFRGTNIGLARSNDGIKWKADSRPWFELKDNEIFNAYDPRLTVLEGNCYICFASDTKHGIRGGIAVTEDFRKLEIISMTVPDNRNMVLFPEKINGKYVRLERPFPVYGRAGKDRFDIWISDSPDLVYWGNSRLLIGVEHVPYANNKIGPAAPPVRTPAGWLTTFHAVDMDPERGKNGWEPFWKKRYSAGIMLLDIDDPSKVIGLYKEPLLAPEAEYEIRGGYRNNVIFPGGMVLEDSGEVKIYYGAADTVECLATASMDNLVSLCTP